MKTLYFIFLSCTPDSLDLFTKLTLLMLQSNLYEMPLFFVLLPWLMLTAHLCSLSFISVNIQFKTHSGCCWLKHFFPCVCADWVVLHFCVLSHLPLEVFYAWMGGDLRVERGHTKGITSPSWRGSTWGSPKCSYGEVAGGKDKLAVKFTLLPSQTRPEYVAATWTKGWMDGCVTQLAK